MIDDNTNRNLNILDQANDGFLKFHLFFVVTKPFSLNTTFHKYKIVIAISLNLQV